MSLQFYSFAKHSPASSGATQEKDGREKMEAIKFMVLYFCPHLISISFSVALVAALPRWGWCINLN